MPFAIDRSARPGKAQKAFLSLKAAALSSGQTQYLPLRSLLLLAKKQVLVPRLHDGDATLKVRVPPHDVLGERTAVRRTAASAVKSRKLVNNGFKLLHHLLRLLEIGAELAGRTRNDRFAQRHFIGCRGNLAAGTLLH